MNDLFYFECRRNHELLQEFRKLVITYSNEVTFSFGSDVYENQQAQAARKEINRKLPAVTKAFYKTPAPRSIQYTPPPIVGGYPCSVELLGNIFNLHRFDIAPQLLIDVLEQAIGFYEDELPIAIRRTINPLAWIYKILSIIVSVPFSLIDLAGFDATRAQTSLAGRLVRLVIEAVVLLASFLTILSYLGYLKAFKKAIGL